MQRFVGIDVARRTHLVAIVGETMTVLVKPTPITEDSAGYEKLIALLGSPADSLIVMEATGHYWRNLFVYLCARDFRCAVINPLRIRRFAQEDLRRAKTDRTDALTIAGSAPRSARSPRLRPILSSTSSASSCACTSAWARILEIVCASSTGSWSSSFPSSPRSCGP
jgi:transposase